MFFGYQFFWVCFLSDEMIQLIEAKWCMYASVSQAIIGSDNALLSDQYQAMMWTNAGLLLIGH